MPIYLHAGIVIQPNRVTHILRVVNLESCERRG